MRNIEFYKMYVMNKKFENTNINPHELLSKIEDMKLNEKEYNDRFLIEYDAKDFKLKEQLFGAFGKIRTDQKPFIFDKSIDKKPKLVEKDLIEINCFSFIPSSQLFMYENNRNGVSINDFKKYLDFFLEKSDLIITFDKVIISENLNSLYDAEQISSISITSTLNYPLKDSKFKTDITNTYGKNEDLIKLGADTFSIALYKKNNNKSLSIQDSLNFIKSLNIQDEELLRLEVDFKGRNRKKKSFINLKDLDKHLKEKILENFEGQIFMATVYEELKVLYYENYYNHELNNDVLIKNCTKNYIIKDLNKVMQPELKIGESLSC